MTGQPDEQGGSRLDPPVPIDPETGEPYTLATLDAWHAYVGLGREWLASDRRADIVRAAS